MSWRFRGSKHLCVFLWHSETVVGCCRCFSDSWHSPCFCTVVSLSASKKGRFFDVMLVTCWEGDFGPRESLIIVLFF